MCVARGGGDACGGCSVRARVWSTAYDGVGVRARTAHTILRGRNGVCGVDDCSAHHSNTKPRRRVKTRERGELSTLPVRSALRKL